MTATVQSDRKLLALHGLRLRPVAAASVVADVAGMDAAEAEAVLSALVDEGLVARREGRISGFALTPAGRQAHQELLAAELEASATPCTTPTGVSSASTASCSRCAPRGS